MTSVAQAAIAYFSMEIALDPSMPTYSGGLGILAGDTVRSAADLGLPMVGVTLLYRKGYFRQRLDGAGNQSEEPMEWMPEEHLEKLEPQVSITLNDQTVTIQAWQYLVRGSDGRDVPVVLLDADLPENPAWARELTGRLYGGDETYRLCQEAVLGLGGVPMLRALGAVSIKTFHLNEGHSALLCLALLAESGGKRGIRSLNLEAIHRVRSQCVFTTHTPVLAGHDKFPLDMARQVLGDDLTDAVKATDCCLENVMNMTYLAAFFSRYINGVSMRHEEVSRRLLSNYPINSITNGVHAATWASPPFQSLYDRHIPEWRADSMYLRYAIGIPLRDIRAAHLEAKKALLDEVMRRSGVELDPQVMTIGFARRATAYKRIDLLFSDIERLKRISEEAGRIQIICAGKAHPQDEGGKDMIRRIFQAGHALKGAAPVVYLEEYDMALARYLCSGSDIWLNTPRRPLEASGTSGMKAALNGVPSLSSLDGWWIEGHLEGITGWSIGDDGDDDDARDAAALYDKLEHTILVTFYERSMDYARVMRSAIALNGSYFNTQRMMFQYLANSYQGISRSTGSPASRHTSAGRRMPPGVAGVGQKFRAT